MNAVRLIVIILCLANAGAKALPESTRSGRILTVEQWVGQVAVVWAFTDAKVIVYHTSDFLMDECRILAEVPLSPEALEILHKSVAVFPAEAYAAVFVGPNPAHAPTLRIDFSPDGSMSDRRIELWGVSLPWQQKFCQQLSEVLPEAWRPSFDLEVEKWQARFPDVSSSVRRRTLDEFYNAPEPSYPIVVQQVEVEGIPPSAEWEKETEPQPGATDNPGDAQ